MIAGSLLIVQVAEHVPLADPAAIPQHLVVEHVVAASEQVGPITA